MSDDSGSWHAIDSDVLQRIATLEERTKPKKKTFVDALQAYGGVAALIIAIGYSWPLGVWEKFFIEPQREVEQKLTEIRDSLSQATGLTIELGKIQSSIANPELRDLAARSTVNQILLLITKYDADYLAYQENLYPEELLIIGLMYQNLYRIEDSLRYFEYVAQHPKTSEIVALEADRQIAKSYLFPSPIYDADKARNIYQRILPKAMQSPRIEIVSQAIIVQSEWGFLEMTNGDWACGVQNMDAAIDKLAKMQALINDQGNTMKLLLAKRRSLSIQPGQPKNGC
jgi:hypothetical protein